MKESDYAHTKVQQYREDKEIDRQLDAQIKTLQGFQKPNDSIANNPTATSTNSKDLKSIDYTQTRFHTFATSNLPPAESVKNVSSISTGATVILGDQSTTKVSNKLVQQKFQQLEAMMKN